MKYLILVRHSLAQNGSFSVPDFERKLSNQGIARAVKQAEVIKKSGFVPDVLISSSAARAMQTATLFAGVLAIASTEKEDFLYEEYTTAEFLTFLNKLPDNNQTVMVVGHNPTLSTVAHRLAPTFSMVLEPAAVVVLAFEEDAWSRVECGAGILVKVFNP
ncbi:MAG: histidine phosphatase family protein [Salinivirgaceae bacterium]